jgi:uncharacterized C2H2 Zn-finger protein
MKLQRFIPGIRDGKTDDGKVRVWYGIKLKMKEDEGVDGKGVQIKLDKCPYCDMKFADPKTLKSHIEAMHR